MGTTPCSGFSLAINLVLWQQFAPGGDLSVEIINQFFRVLASQGASRMVIAHTPLIPAVVPRFGGKVLVIDVGLAKHYGGGFASLEIEDDGVFAIMRGARLKMPSNAEELIDYLAEAAAVEPDPAKINNYIQLLLNPEPVEDLATEKELPVQHASP